MKPNKANCLTLLLILFFLPMQVMADESPLALKMDAVIVSDVMQEGKVVEVTSPLPKMIEPYEVIQYTIKGNNMSTAPLNKVAVSGKIPTGTQYQPGTAFVNSRATILFSIDGGKSYAKPPIYVDVKQPDGRIKKIQVSIDQYTDIRFVVERLTAGTSFSAVYRVAVQ